MTEEETKPESKEVNPEEFIEGAEPQGDMETGEVGTEVADGEEQPAEQPLKNTPLRGALDKLFITVVNAKFLSASTDSRVTKEEIEETGISSSVLDCVDYYLPSLPINHPLSALAVAGLGIVLLVNGKKGSGSQLDKIETEPKKETGKKEPDKKEEPIPFEELKAPDTDAKPETHSERLSKEDIDNQLQTDTNTAP